MAETARAETMAGGGARLSRRQLVGGVCAALGGQLLPAWAGADERPQLAFGVISDVHIGGRREAPQRLACALRWLARRNVDAVLCPGDVTHTGRIAQLEQFAAIWHAVFPGGRAPDGHAVPLMISTGNHDADDAFWRNASEATMRATRLTYGDNAAKAWERLFGEKWALVWRREVKGYTFIGSQWPQLNPQLEAFVKAQGGTFDPSRPFFHCQHEHPRGTCHGAYGRCGWDQGQSVAAFSPYPNAVVFSGHSHCSLADERTVWQGAFTSIGAGCLHEGGLAFGYDNCSAFWHRSFKENLMAPLNDAAAAWGGDPDGGCFEYVEVFARHLVVHRRSSVYDRPIGPAWVVPVPVARAAAYAPSRRAAARRASQFAADAVLAVEVCPRGSPLESRARAGEPCVRAVIPPAGAVDGCRVFTYDVAVQSGARTVASGKVFAAGFSLPDAEAARPTDWLVALKDLPPGEDLVVVATPRECFGHAGRPLRSAPFRIPSRPFQAPAIEKKEKT